MLLSLLHVSARHREAVGPGRQSADPTVGGTGFVNRRFAVTEDVATAARRLGLALVAAGDGEALRRPRALEVLERLDTPEARRFLSDLANGAPVAPLTREAAAAVARLQKTATDRHR